MNKKALKTFSLDEITDKHIGKHGTQKRDAFEYNLHLDLLQESNQPRQAQNLEQ